MSNRLNLLSPEFQTNPYPFYEELRRRGVCQVEPGGLWAVARYEDVMYVLKNPQHFSSEGMKLTAEPPWFGRKNPVCESIIMMDPPRHGRLRTLLSRSFGPATLARLEPRLRAKSEELVTRMLERREVDFVDDFALPIPVDVLGALLGLDPSLQSRFKEWADDIVSIGTTHPDDTEKMAKSRRTVEEMEHYLGEVMESRRRAPGDDMVSDLLRAQVEGESLTDAEVMGFLFVLLLAGLEATMHLISQSGKTLMEHPEVLERLRADRSLLPKFIEEVLRYEAPSQATLRICTAANVTVGGVSLPQGSPVLVIQASACRDENYCPDSNRFDLDRPGPQNLPFGHGIHYCLGAQLARLEARVALEVLISRVGTLVERGERQWVSSLSVRGLKKLPMEVLPLAAPHATLPVVG